MPGGIGSRQDQNAIVGLLNAVEFVEELVDQVPPRAHAHVAAIGTEGVNFIKEQNARFDLSGFLEDGVQVFFTLSQPHVQDFVDAHRHKIALDLARGSPG